MSRVLDLGGGHVLRPFSRFENGPTIGYIEEHPDARDPSKVCAGSIYLEGAAELGRCFWYVRQADPLTLEPSILCSACGNHGWVRDGKWVQA